MKTYEVTLIGYRTMLVEAPDEEKAMDIAMEEESWFDWEHDETRIDGEYEPGDKLERAKKHYEFIKYDEETEDSND